MGSLLATTSAGSTVPTWFAVVTLVVPLLVVLATELLRGRQATATHARERRAARTDERHNFERDTLLELGGALLRESNAFSIAMSAHFDEYREKGVWPSFSLTHPHLAETIPAHREVQRLQPLVLEEEVRSLVFAWQAAMMAAVSANTVAPTATAEAAYLEHIQGWMNAAEAYSKAQEAVGARVRELFG